VNEAEKGREGLSLEIIIALGYLITASEELKGNHVICLTLLLSRYFITATGNETKTQTIKKFFHAIVLHRSEM